MPNAKRSGASRKKAHKAKTNGTTSPSTSSSNTTPNPFSASSSTSSFTFTSPPGGPIFPPPPASPASSSRPSSSGKKSYTVPASSSESSDESSDSGDASSNGGDVPEADETPAPIPDSSLAPEERLALAAREKELGNAHFKTADYPTATRLYTHAIELDPANASYRTNRAASYMASKLFSKALGDCLAAAEIQKADPQPKTLLRLARCQLALGLVAEAGRTLDALLPLDASKAVMAERQKVDRLKTTLANIRRDLARAEWSMVLLGVDAAVREVDETPREWRIWKIEALCGKKRWDEAAGMAADLLRANPQQPEALYYRGLALYYLGNHPQSIAHCTEALRNDPDYAKARTLLRKVKNLDALKDAGNDAFKTGKMQLAVQKYSEALDVDPDNVVLRATLLSNRATAFQKMGDPTKALADCDACLVLQPNYWKAMRTRARVHLAGEDWDAAIRDFKAAYELAPAGSTDEAALKREIKDAETGLKKSKMKDHYKTLGITAVATEDEIKKAYRRQSLIHHPDKGGSDDRFKEVGEAYAILSDPVRRRKFDAGIDESDPMSGMGSDFGDMGGFPGHSHGFEHMFGGGGGFGGGFGGGGGGYGGGARGNPYGF